MVRASSLTDTYGVFTYKDPLIMFGVENFRNWKHREYAIRADPICKTYICKLDEEILSERPIFVPDIFGMSTPEIIPNEEEEGLESPAVPTESEETAYDISEEWDTEKWDLLLLEMFNMARTHSFCVVQLYDRKPYWHVFTDREITEIQYDNKDNPIGCKVEWSKRLEKSAAEKERYHKETLRFYDETKDNNDGTALFVPFGVPVGDNLGEYDLEHIWSLSIWMRYINLDIANNSAKSSGFYHLIYGDSLTDSKRDDLVDAMDIAGGMRAIGAKEDALKQIVPIHPENAQFSIEAAEEMMLMVAGAARLPLSFFRGEREAGGMNSGFSGYIDEGKVTEKKKFVFKQFSTYIKKLIEMRWGIVIEDIQPYIKSEQEQMQFEQFNMENNNNQFGGNSNGGS